MYRINIKRYMSYVSFVSCVALFYYFIFNSFAIIKWMYFVVIEKKYIFIFQAITEYNFDVQ